MKGPHSERRRARAAKELFGSLRVECSAQSSTLCKSPVASQGIYQTVVEIRKAINQLAEEALE
jgi:hypothetical protein